MKPDFRNATMLGFERGIFNLTNNTGKCVVINATPLPDISDELKSAMVCEQPFRPEYLDLERKAYTVEPILEHSDAGSVVVFASRNRRVNEHNVTRAWNMSAQGASIIIAGDKNSGTASLRKWIAAKTDIIESFSKHHALVFEIVKSGDPWVLPDLSVLSGDYKTSEGMFSADAPDRGSQILAEHFDKRLYGRVADFGAGWGYLSAQLLKRCERITSIDVYEADWHSLEAAKQNLADANIDMRFHWCDILQEYKKHVLDWVVMNPPFHSGRAAEPAIGQKFIATAASTLPSGGRLLMVANRNLPYEQTLERLFKAFEIIEDKDGFKVIEARK